MNSGRPDTLYFRPYSYLHICWHNAFEKKIRGKWHWHPTRSSFSHNSIVCSNQKSKYIFGFCKTFRRCSRLNEKKRIWMSFDFVGLLSPKITLKHKVLKSWKNMLNSFQDNIQVPEKEWSDLDECVRRYERMLCQRVSPLKGGVEPFLCPNTWMISPAGFSREYRRTGAN